MVRHQTIRGGIMNFDDWMELYHEEDLTDEEIEEIYGGE